MSQYEIVIGLETHAQLQTQSKMFCSCATKFGAEPNTNICPICTGQPGTLPVVNKKAIELAIKTALALNCQIESQSIFARKNYFYPDLPKDYQVSQYDRPLATKGYLEIEVEGKTKKIGITRVHLEEDAGKLTHQGAARIMGSEGSLVDYNRTGTPLMEIVSEPDIRTPQEASAYMEKLAALLRYIEVCDAKMEEGSLRCDANISIMPAGTKEFGTRTELKNMNSFKAVEKAMVVEAERQEEIIEAGGKITQETRVYDDTTGTTSSMRSKEEAHDYRYFPEPDLVPVEPSQEWVNEIKDSLGELPAERQARFMADYKLSNYNAALLISDKVMANFFEETIKLNNNAKAVANWLVGDITAYLKEQKKSITEVKFTPVKLAELLELIGKGTISGKIAKTVLLKVLESGQSVKEVVVESGMTQISDEDELVKVIAEVIKNNPKQVEQYKGGKTTVIAFFVGQVMKATKGRANPGLVNKLLSQKLA
ncbi:Asp-tRNA(Asn)/Glu-tRNA(Gln) amidotransferase GatCAB subunit B [Candidatus Saganbacteria bacterium CG08_land_8_20_14_0_20_45_16]|uniref:Aspartyl/glutamyl-tRNA(Asn/Gln) amidotransferase subunit B n=1 Tax=Candidatus Saganbacteria bacterium CG08_land_8_20_14_0_20_45_16 TaxID=2014293 RepID=A0A2H0Y1X7_UNCSA|nr:MAG: Asp-tRNA(Asn)/Glu-tRNA(Gln) amidotransferase GatCAB subunit B [Candidatus Saganbacteria bacterium CG08_land_8_20_14_0_20_45_16]